jgi:hypothetical protein
VTEKPSMQHCVQLAVLTLIAAHETLDQLAVATRCPGANSWDIKRALEILLEEGSVEKPGGGLSWLAGIDKTKELRLSETGRRRLADRE